MPPRHSQNLHRLPSKPWIPTATVARAAQLILSPARVVPTTPHTPPGAHVVERCACAALNASLGRTTIPVLDSCGPPGGRLEFPGSVAQLQCCPGLAAQDPLITPLPDYDPAALSPCKREARREANKSSWDARLNQTFCRSLVRSLVICLWRTCGRERPSHILEGLPGNDPITVWKTQVPQDEGSSFLGQLLSYRAARGDIMDTCSKKPAHGPADFGTQVLFVKITRPALTLEPKCFL